MRRPALGLVSIAAATPAVAAASATTPHPWRLIIQDEDDGGACGFDTFEQCRVEARSGKTGFRARNRAFQPHVGPARPKKRDRR
jgi:hypothetical protein